MLYTKLNQTYRDTSGIYYFYITKLDVYFERLTMLNRLL